MKKVIAYWFLWSVCLIFYQQLVTSRFVIKKPDTALYWTIFETQEHSWNFRPYLLHNFLNQHVAWDSEFYLAIADKGYDNELVRKAGGRGESYSLNYAFFPFYPLMIRIFYYPLCFFEKFNILTRIETLTLSGVIVSLLGTFIAFISLHLFMSGFFDNETALRGVFYFSVFPSAFFMGEVYTEGLFCGLFFLSILLIINRRWTLAGILSSLAFLTRPAGILLVPFYILQWIKEIEWKNFSFKKVKILSLLPVLIPVTVFLAWKFSPLGYRFEFVEFAFFGRSGFDLINSFLNWKEALYLLFFSGNPPTRAYYFIEFIVILITIFSFLLTGKKFVNITILGILIFIFSITSGVSQGMHRYLLPVTNIYIMLVRLGKNQIFDRIWSIFSILLFGLLSMLFSFDMWAG